MRCGAAQARHVAHAAERLRQLGGSDKAAGMVEVARGALAPGASMATHLLSPLCSWQLRIEIAGYEESPPIVLHEADSSYSRALNLLSRVTEAFEAKPRSSSANHPVQKVQVHNTLLAGGSRAVRLYVPYWLLNETGWPLLFREVRPMA
jgi:hypothetical protein